jgi:cell division protein FtsL
MPFSIPPRNCIGKIFYTMIFHVLTVFIFSGMSFAMMSMKVSLSNIIRNFQIISTQHKSVESIKLRINELLASKDGYGVTLKLRKK